MAKQSHGRSRAKSSGKLPGSPPSKSAHPSRSASRKRPSRSGSKKSSRSKPLSLAARLLYGGDADFRLINPRTHAIERVVDRQEMSVEIDLRKEELRQQYQLASRVLKRVVRWARAGHFGPDAGCTVALRRKHGRIISPLRYGIEVHVPAKISERNLRKWPKSNSVKKLVSNDAYCVPREVDGVLTKVVESSAYRTTATDWRTAGVVKSAIVRLRAGGRLADISTDPDIALKRTQLIGGLPTVESDQGNWGTLGIAYQDTTGGKVFGIVNAHFANGDMVQPPFKPRSDNLAQWQIGSVAKDSKFEGKIDGERAGEKFYVDAALIQLNGNRSRVLNLVQDFEKDGFLYAASYLRHFHRDSPRRDIFQKVYKFGASSSARKEERIEGHIENPEDSSVSFDGRLIGSVIMARSKGGVAFTLPGDSGSVLVAPVFDLETNRERLMVVGLCFAGNEGVKEVVYACQFAAVLKALELNISQDLLRTDWRYSKP